MIFSLQNLIFRSSLISLSQMDIVQQLKSAYIACVLESVSSWIDFVWSGYRFEKINNRNEIWDLRFENWEAIAL